MVHQSIASIEYASCSTAGSAYTPIWWPSFPFVGADTGLGLLRVRAFESGMGRLLDRVRFGAKRESATRLLLTNTERKETTLPSGPNLAENKRECCWSASWVPRPTNCGARTREKKARPVCGVEGAWPSQTEKKLNK
jgi:hypothetical protein